MNRFINRRQFFGATAAVATSVVIPPRAFVRVLSDRDRPVKLPTAQATIRLYHFGKLVIEQDVSLDIEGSTFGKGQSILIEGDCFSFNKVTVQLKGLADEEIMGMRLKPIFEREMDLPLFGQMYTITEKNTVTLSFDERGIIGLG